MTVFSFAVLSIPVFVMAQLLKFGGLQLNEAAGTAVLYFQGEVTPSFRGSAGLGCSTGCSTWCCPRWPSRCR